MPLTSRKIYQQVSMDSLDVFRKEFPEHTSADLQTYTMGFSRGYSAASLINMTHSDNELLAVLRNLSRAQGRMLDNWADYDEAGKKILWQELHSAGQKARDLIDSLPVRGGIS